MQSPAHLLLRYLQAAHLLGLESLEETVELEPDMIGWIGSSVDFGHLRAGFRKDFGGSSKIFALQKIFSLRFLPFFSCFWPLPSIHIIIERARLQRETPTASRIRMVREGNEEQKECWKTSRLESDFRFQASLNNTWKKEKVFLHRFHC